MLRQNLPSKPLCSACSRQVLELFVGGLTATPTLRVPRIRLPVATPARPRHLHSARPLRQSHTPANPDFKEDVHAEDIAPDAQEPSLSTDQQRELKARQARQQFGESLPLDFLSVDEYRIYERLYGPPLSFVGPEDAARANATDEDAVDALRQMDGPDAPEQNLLLRELEDGSLEEVTYTEMADEARASAQNAEQTGEEFGEEEDYIGANEALDPQDMDMLRDLESARSLAQRQLQAQNEGASRSDSFASEAHEDGWAFDAEEGERDYTRTHPLTEAGRFATSPRTVRMPAVELTEPIQSHLASHAKYEHLIEAAHNTFGDRLLPDSNATPPKHNRHLIQKPIPLSASQPHMSQLQANLFLSTIVPGAYATTLSILTEVRKRLGSSWLEGMLQRKGGPRILDAGGAGAGVIAWREVLKAEWERLHEASGRVAQEHLNFGKSTVLAGSRELQSAASHLLDDTSFIPRLPQIDRVAEAKAEQEGREPPRRKQYDVIVAPYGIWQIEEDWMRKSYVQNLWSLLDPDGGVLVLFEKGLPRGFEAIAGARDVLLKHHIRDPHAAERTELTDAVEQRHSAPEEGMIVAPCTNHGKCPMAAIPGEMVGRRDFCRFQQRFERPPFLQRIHQVKFHNYEDISYSYVAVQRGRDARTEHGFRQDERATQAAFKGYEGDAEAAQAPPPHMLTLPRIISPPLKRTGHVTYDVCTPRGSIERWTTPRSFSYRAYRDARKARWGDLWALGAKTRFGFSLQTGRPKGEKKMSRAERLARAEVGSEEAGLLNLVEKQVNQRAKVKKGDKGWKEKIGRRDKYGSKPMTRKIDRKKEELLGE